MEDKQTKFVPGASRRSPGKAEPMNMADAAQVIAWVKAQTGKRLLVIRHKNATVYTIIHANAEWMAKRAGAEILHRS